MGPELPGSGAHAHAPAVSYPLSRPVFLHAVLVAVLVAAGCIDLGWLARAPAGDWRPWVGLAATAAVALCWHVGGALTASGHLCWDGQSWRWETATEAQDGLVRLQFDGQSRLLVLFVAASGARRWLWLSRSSDPARWLALRRAIHGQAQPGEGAAGARVAPS